jgi:hypothetical protein
MDSIMHHGPPIFLGAQRIFRDCPNGKGFLALIVKTPLSFPCKLKTMILKYREVRA